MSLDELQKAIADGKIERSKIEDNVEEFMKIAANNDIEALKAILIDDVKCRRLINSTDASKRTALHFACHSGNNVTFDLLIKYNADINAVDFDKYTPLMMACKMLNSKMAERLIAMPNCKIDLMNKEGFTALHLAVMNSLTSVVKALLDRNAIISLAQSESGSLLHAACGIKDTDVIDLLVAKEPRLLNTLDSNKMSPLHMACAYGNTKLALDLIKLGANVNAIGTGGVTPLHICVDSENLEIIKALADKGAVLRLDSDGVTPMLMALNKKNKVLEQALANCKFDATPYQGKGAQKKDTRVTPESLKENGNKAFRRNEFDVALNWYQLALDVEDVTNEVTPNKLEESIAYQLHANMSICHAHLKSFDEALKSAEMSIQLSPSWPRGYLRKAQALEHLGRTDEAKVAMDKMNELTAASSQSK
eukprot:gene15502-18413_t